HTLTISICTLSLHDALPILKKPYVIKSVRDTETDEVVYRGQERNVEQVISKETAEKTMDEMNTLVGGSLNWNSSYELDDYTVTGDRKSTRLNSSHVSISYAV